MCEGKREHAYREERRYRADNLLTRCHQVYVDAAVAVRCRTFGHQPTPTVPATAVAAMTTMTTTTTTTTATAAAVAAAAVPPEAESSLVTAEDCCCTTLQRTLVIVWPGRERRLPQMYCNRAKGSKGHENFVRCLCLEEMLFLGKLRSELLSSSDVPRCTHRSIYAPVMFMKFARAIGAVSSVGTLGTPGAAASPRRLARLLRPLLSGGLVGWPTHCPISLSAQLFTDLRYRLRSI